MSSITIESTTHEQVRGLRRTAAVLTPVNIVIFLSHILVIAALIRSTTPHVPFMDEWEMVDMVHLTVQGKLHPSDLWANHGEHNLTVARLINLPLIVLTDWNRQAMMLVNLGIAIASLGFLLLTLRATSGKWASWLALPTTVLALSFAQFENWLAPFQLTFIATGFSACCCTWAFAHRRVSRARFGIALVSALIGSYASLAGMVLWVAFLPAVWWSGKRRLALWLPAGGVVAVSLALGQLAVAGRYEQSGTPLQYAVFALAYLGLPITYPFAPLAFALGFLSLIPIVATLYICWHTGELSRRLGGWFGLLLFAGGCAAMTTLGRGPGLGSLTSRYLIFAALWWIAGFVFIAAALEQGLPGAWHKPSLAYLHLLGMLVFTGLVGANWGGFLDARTFQLAQRQHENCVLHFATADDSCLRIAYPVAETLRVRAAYLAQDQLGPFTPHVGNSDTLPRVSTQSLDAVAGRTPASSATLASIDWCQVLVSRPHQEPVIVPARSPLAIGGWAVDTATGTAATGVVIVLDGQPIALADYGVEMPDIGGIYGNPPYPGARFRATIPQSALTPGRHIVTIRVLANDNHQYYTTAQQIPIEVR